MADIESVRSQPHQAAVRPLQPLAGYADSVRCCLVSGHWLGPLNRMAAFSCADLLNPILNGRTPVFKVDACASLLIAGHYHCSKAAHKRPPNGASASAS